LELKAEGYEFEGQSYLFWEYMRILNEVKPKYFLLENVEMGEKWEKVLSKAIGVNGIHINSALVSAQNRKRIFWTNIGMQPMGLFGYPESIIQQPKDKGILLKDILENEVDEKYFLSKRMINSFKIKTQHFKDNGGGFCFKPSDGNNKGRTLTNPGKNRMDDNFIVHNTMPRSGNPKQGGTGHLSRNDGKPYCLDTGNTNAVEIVAMRGRTENKGQDWHNSNHIQKLESRNDGKTNSITGVAKDNLVREVKQISNNNKSNGGTQPYQQDIIYDIDGISPALCANKSDLIITSIDIRSDEGLRENKSNKAFALRSQAGGELQGKGVKVNSRIRRLTPIECERLQTVKDNYTAHVSDSQRYRMLGNGWTIDVICHILSYIK
jgi:DNA (cytosine-5)-methyltransferase 3A